MKIARCKNGHFFDMDLHSSCPKCNEEIHIDASGSDTSVDGTVQYEPALDKERPYGPGTSLWDILGPGGFVWDAWERCWIPKGKAWEKEYDGGPVTGWLVCIEGKKRGRSYCIYRGYNHILHDNESEITIRTAGEAREDVVSLALILYDAEQKKFYIGNGHGHCAIRKNERLLMAPEELRPYDELQIGDSKFRFVPFCGENFSWEE